MTFYLLLTSDDLVARSERKEYMNLAVSLAETKSQNDGHRIYTSSKN